jgi:beta-lactamase superfamily II metal-dependent hydrolase
MPIGFVRRHPNGTPIWLYATRSLAASQRVRDARWGDVLNIVAQDGDGWAEIAWGDARYFIRDDEIVAQRPLELLFVDVGQGDGCIVVPPEMGADERIIIVDAGQYRNMLGLLTWRFGKLMQDLRFHAAVLTHPDQDHYLGFRDIFRHPHVHFDRVYHNGIVERAGPEPLGSTDASGRYLTDTVVSQADMEAVYAAGGPNQSKTYGRVMRAALDGGRVAGVEMLSTLHGHSEDGRTWLPQFAPSDGRACTIEVLGPVPEPGADGRPWLRWFGTAIGSTAKNVAMTKNGHSIVLRLDVGGLRILLGGDLNQPAEDYLLRHYSGIAPTAPLSSAVPDARARLEADIMKSCHHGAADVTDAFLQAVNPFAFIVSSGDEESHAHPRPDLLGRLGKQGRGEAPLILCTELLRSTRERGVAADFARLRVLDALIDDPATSDEERERAQAERSALQKRIEYRNVGVYGAITVRTDGQHGEISFMLERPRGKQRWQIYRLARRADGEWTADLAGT